jgi:cytoskeletal protein CcmA (bactofilin family)
MALFGKEEKTERREETPISPAGVTSPQPRFESQPGRVDFQAQLGQGSRIEGKLTFEGSVRIDGQIEGEISSQDTVMIGEGAVVNAQIQATTIVILGRVQGDITARKRVELRSPAKLIGNINTPSLVIHEGVVFEGHCSMGAGESRSEKPDKKVAIFPKEDRTVAARLTSEAAT